MKPLIAGVALLLSLAAAAVLAEPAARVIEEDPYLWLEEVGGDRPLDWVRAHNSITQNELEASPEFAPIHDRLLAIYDSSARIPYVAKRGPWYYNFWRDAQQVRGVWRRTTLAEYRKQEPEWETVLDLDALAASENENWVWHGSHCLYPDYRRCLLRLSRGGGDAVVVREFDVIEKKFIDDGFELPEAKSEVTWRDRDSVYVATDFGPGQPGGSLTASGYARVVKEWTRGTKLAEARTVFEGRKEDVAVQAMVSDEPGYHREMIRRGITFYTSENFLRIGGDLVPLDVPADAEPSTYRDQLLVQLRTDWTVGGKTYPGGALLATNLEAFLRGERKFSFLFTPGPRKSLAGVTDTLNALIVNELDNVRNKLYLLQPTVGVTPRAAGVTNTGTVTMEDCSLDLNGGAAIYNSGTLYLRRSTIRANSGGLTNSGNAFVDQSLFTANFGANASALYNDGLLVMNNSTVSGNSASPRVHWINPDEPTGAVYNDVGTARLSYVTITDNIGGGIYNDAALSLSGSIVAGNLTVEVVLDPFDSSYDRGQPATFPLANVIPGWTEGLQLMKAGGKAKFAIPSALAYGERGAGGKIGPNETLVFEVELISVEKAGDAPKPADKPAEAPAKEAPAKK